MLADGADAGAFAAGAPPPPPLRVEGALAAKGGALGLVAAMSETGRAKAFVDFQNDVTARDIQLAAREGMRSIEHIKRYTTMGMATDQGKIGNMNALAIAAGRSEADRRSRPDDVPAALYAGDLLRPSPACARRDLFDPIRETPLHGWSARQGAKFEDAGLWKRASYFAGMARAPKKRCSGNVWRRAPAPESWTRRPWARSKSSAPTPLNSSSAVYVNAFAKLAVGRCRYALMLSEDGFIVDDGVVMRLAADRFHVTTTSSGAARVFATMEDYSQTEWRDLEVWPTSITEQFATMAINGPDARKILEPLVEGIDLSAGRVAAHERARRPDLRRADAVGAGQLHRRTRLRGQHCRRLRRERRRSDLGGGAKARRRPLRTGDAARPARRKRLHRRRPRNTDGAATPDDVGMGRMVALSKPDFIGKRSLSLPDLGREGRKQLVGLLPLDPNVKLEEGAQIVAQSGAADRDAGPRLVSSSYMSATLGRSFALGLVANGRARLGATLFATTREGTAPVRLVAPIFYDKEGQRLAA